MEDTERKLDKAYKLINTFMQWFIIHKLDYGDDVRQAIKEFYEV